MARLTGVGLQFKVNKINYLIKIIVNCHQIIKLESEIQLGLGVGWGWSRQRVQTQNRYKSLYQAKDRTPGVKRHLQSWFMYGMQA